MSEKKLNHLLHRYKYCLRDYWVMRYQPQMDLKYLTGNSNIFWHRETRRVQLLNYPLPPYDQLKLDGGLKHLLSQWVQPILNRGLNHSLPQWNQLISFSTTVRSETDEQMSAFHCGVGRCDCISNNWVMRWVHFVICNSLNMSVVRV